MPQKELVPTRKNEFLSFLTHAHLHTQRKGTQTICLFTVKPFLRKMQAITSRLDFSMKKERKWLLRQCNVFASNRNQDFLQFMKCEKSVMLPTNYNTVRSSVRGLTEGNSWGYRCHIKSHCCCILKEAFVKSLI